MPLSYVNLFNSSLLLPGLRANCLVCLIRFSLTWPKPTLRLCSPCYHLSLIFQQTLITTITGLWASQVALVVKEPACQCGRHKRLRFDSWVGKIPWRWKWQPTLVFLPGEWHGQRSLVGYSPWGRKKSDTTEVT